MRTTFFLLLILFPGRLTVCQNNVIVNVSGKSAGTFIPLDTIVIENISQADTLIVSPLPQEITTYIINLSQGKLINGLFETHAGSGCNLIKNSPDIKQILLSLSKSTVIKISISAIDGKLLSNKSYKCQFGNNFINITGGIDPIYILSILTDNYCKSFKIIGNSESNDFSINILNEGEILKQISDDNFQYSPGDELVFTAKKNGYYFNSTRLIPANGDSITIYLSSPCPGFPTVTDIDGNIYRTVLINYQCWLKENIKSKHYADGTPLVDGTGVGNWESDFSTKYWFDYDDDPDNSLIYGRLYSAAAALNGESGLGGDTIIIQGICPNGWHIPSNIEWKSLELFLGIDFWDLEGIGFQGTDEGDKLKETGNYFWWQDNGKNTYGFSALGSGIKYGDGRFEFLRIWASFWSSTATNQYILYTRGINARFGGIYNEGGLFDTGYSCRCIKD
jgi:uncharacterized protein (TIGR02145 family)